MNVPVMHAQNIKDPVQAARALESGLIDFVGMTRAHIADPHLITKVKLGQTDQIRQCVGANYCIDRQYQGIDVLCIQNAATSREGKVPHIISKTDGPIRKVVVVGGGPGGMEAARVCAERGHNVTLFEKNATLGGQISLAAKAPQREQIAGITRWFELELRRLGVNLVFDVTADESVIMAENPDVVVLAVGGKPFINQQPEWGGDDGLITSTWDILSGAVEPGKNVVIYDTICEFAGMSVADYLAAKGSLVEIVTDDIKPGVAVGGTSFPTYYRSLYERDVVMTPDLVLESVYREGDKLIARFENEYTGVREERVVDQVIVENGVRPDESLYYALKEGSRNHGRWILMPCLPSSHSLHSMKVAATCSTASVIAAPSAIFTQPSTTRCVCLKICKPRRGSGYVDSPDRPNAGRRRSPFYRRCVPAYPYLAAG